MGQGQSATFPYGIGSPVSSYEGKSPWRLHTGTRKKDGAAVSIFVFAAKEAANEERVAAARNGYKRFRTIHHPKLLKYDDGAELADTLYIVTEPVRPLEDCLDEVRRMDPDFVSFQFHQLFSAVSFLNNDGHLLHGLVIPSSIFVTRAGDWKLGNLDLLSEGFTPDSTFKRNVDLLPSRYKPPELLKSNWTLLATTTATHCIDSWTLGCCIWEVYNGPMQRGEQLRHVGKIPKALVPEYHRLLTAAPSSRANPRDVLNSKYFQNSVVEALLFLEEIMVKDAMDRGRFFRGLPQLLDCIPPEARVYRILPQLVASLEYGGEESAQILPALLTIGGQLTEEEYSKQVVPGVMKLFQSNDRTVRLSLLQSLDQIVPHVSHGLVNDNLFPSVVNGFSDTSPVIRELSVKAMIHMVPKMKESVVNTQLLPIFARLQQDPEPAIRANTTICLGKLAPHLSPETRKKILISAFSRPLNDTFPPARMGALMAFCATIEFYSNSEIATRVIPAISPMTIDPEKDVRVQAFKTLRVLIARLETSSERPEGVRKDTEEPAGNATARSGTLTTAAEGVLSWMSSLKTRIPGTHGKREEPVASDVHRPQQPPQPPSTTGKAPPTAPKNPDFSSTVLEPVKASSVSTLRQNDDDDDDGDDAKESGGWDDVDDEGGWEPFDVAPAPKTVSGTPLPVSAAPVAPTTSTASDGWKFDDDFGFGETSSPGSTTSPAGAGGGGITRDFDWDAVLSHDSKPRPKIRQD